MGEHCIEHPKCREDLLRRINMRMSTKSFVTTLGTIVVVGGIISGMAYNAYSQRQKNVQEAVEKQTETVQKADKKLTEIEVNQRHVMKKQDDFKGQVDAIENNQHLILQEIIKIREHQTNGD